MAWNKESIIRLETIDSTNSYLRDEACNLWKKIEHEDLVVVTAKHQTAGRGQRGNTWSSNAGENLLFSILVRPGTALHVARQFFLSQATAVALHDAMQQYGIDVRLKWPNDIYAGNRKLAGILLELDYSGTYVEQAIIGIGLNVNQQTFPMMDRIPVSMKMLKERDFIPDDILDTILGSFEHYYQELRNGNGGTIAAEYTKLLLGLGEERTFVDKESRFQAVIEGVENDGHLLIRRNDGTLQRYAFKEIEQLL